MGLATALLVRLQALRSLASPCLWRPTAHATETVVVLLAARDDPNRTVRALATYHRCQPALLICSGGLRDPQPGLISAAEQAAAWLQAHGVPREHLLIECASRTTRDQALRLTPLLTSHDCCRPDAQVLVVTAAVHLPRALGALRRVGVAAHGVPVRPSTARWTHEVVGWAAYWWRGWLA